MHAHTTTAFVIFTQCCDDLRKSFFLSINEHLLVFNIHPGMQISYNILKHQQEMSQVYFGLSASDAFRTHNPVLSTSTHHHQRKRRGETAIIPRRQTAASLYEPSVSVPLGPIRGEHGTQSGPSPATRPPRGADRAPGRWTDFHSRAAMEPMPVSARPVRTALGRQSARYKRQPIWRAALSKCLPSITASKDRRVHGARRAWIRTVHIFVDHNTKSRFCERERFHRSVHRTDAETQNKRNPRLHRPSAAP